MKKAYKGVGIRQRLIIVFGVVILCFFAILFFSNYYLDRIVKETESLALTSRMIENVLEMRRHEKNLIMRNLPKYIDLVRTFSEKLKSNIYEYRQRTNRRNYPTVDALYTQLNTYNRIFEECVKKQCYVGRKDINELIMPARAILAFSKKLEQVTVEDMLLYQRKILISRILVACLFLVAGGVTFLIVSRGVVTPIQRLQILSRDMGKEGVLTPGIVHHMDKVVKEISTADEIGELARAYRSMVIRYYNSYLSLQDKMKEVEELSKIKVEFAQMVSHELRTPLTAIKEVVDLLFYEVSGSLHKDQKDFLKVAKRNIDRLGRLINDILDFSKLSSRKLAMKVEPCALNEIIESVLHIHKMAIEKKGLMVTTQIRATKDVSVLADADRLNQVLTNLIGNAVKFTEKGDIVLTTVLDEKSVMAKVSVSDTGEGIAAEHIKGLFQPFTQFTDNTRKKREGTGLGLSICKLIVEQCGGAIWAESVLGKGSKFTFSLKVAEERHPA